MSNPHHIVTFAPEAHSALGIDDHDPCKSSVRPANLVLRCVQRPPERNDFVSEAALADFVHVTKFLEELGEAAVLISPHGVVVGKYSVQPCLISMREFALLRTVFP